MAIYYYTFSTKGLTNKQIIFLGECERLFFEGKDVNNKMMVEAYNNCGFHSGNTATKCIEAWDYWHKQKFAVDKQSIMKPINFSDLFVKKMDERVLNDDKYFHVSDSRLNDGCTHYVSYYVKINEEYFKSLDLNIIYPMKSIHFSFNIMADNRVYLQYQNIIGSILIAYIK